MRGMIGSSVMWADDFFLLLQRGLDRRVRRRRPTVPIEGRSRTGLEAGAGGGPAARGPSRAPRPRPWHGARDGGDPVARRRHLRQRGAHAPARARLRPLRPEPGRPRAPRLPPRRPRGGRDRAPPVQLPPGSEPRRTAPATPAARRLRRRLHPARAPRADGRLQRVASRTDHAPAPARVRLTDAPHAADPSVRVPALPARPDLLGRRARGRGVPRPPEPARAPGLRPPAGGRQAPGAPSRAGGTGVGRGGPAAARRVAPAPALRLTTPEALPKCTRPG